MRTYATAQHTGDRSTQCDATAVRTAPSGARAYALLDGIGSSEDVRDWTRRAAVQVARSAAQRADAEQGLRAAYSRYAAEPDRHDPYMRRYLPAATAPGRPLTVAWCGDSRAYLLRRGIVHRLTDDHNLRRVQPPTALHPYGGNRNLITSYLGSADTDEEVMEDSNHPAIEATTIPLNGPCRLVLASDGAYEPHADAGNDLYIELDDDPLSAVAREFVNNAVEQARSTALPHERPHADNATVLVADLNR